MAEIKICGKFVPTDGGPSMPIDLSATLKERPWPVYDYPSGGSYQSLVIFAGASTIEISMIEDCQIKSLHASLGKLLGVRHD